MRSEYRPLLIMMLLLASVPAFLHVVDPPARDQGVFALIAWRWSAGDVPYASAGLEHKGPLPFLGYRLGFAFFGNEMRSARLMAALALLVSGFLVAGIGGRWLSGRRRGAGVDAIPGGTGVGPDRYAAAGVGADHAAPAEWGSPPGVFAGVIYLLIVGAGGLSAYWSGAQAESFMEPFAILAVVSFAIGMERAGAVGPFTGVLASGLCLGVATLGKPTALLLAPALLFAWPGSRLRILAPLAIGVAIPWVAAAGYCAARGAFGDFTDAVFLMNASYGARGIMLLPSRLDAFVQSHHVVIHGFFLIPAFAGMLWLWPHRRRPEVRLLFGWTLAAYAQILIQGRMFGYHYHPVVAPVALLATGGVVEAFRRARGGAVPARLLAAALAAALALGIAGMPWIETEVSFQRLTGRISETRFLQHFSPGGARSDVDPVDTFNAARYAERSIGPDETLLVWGFEPAVNYLSRRRCPTRFIYDYYLTSPAVPAVERERNLRLFWKDLAASPPDWIAVVHHDTNPVEGKDSAEQLREIPELRAYLSDNYVPKAQIGDFEFFRRDTGR